MRQVLETMYLQLANQKVGDTVTLAEGSCSFTDFVMRRFGTPERRRHWRVIEVCDGGYVRLEQRLRVICHGHGRVDDENGNWETCPECRGSGVVDENDNDQPIVREPE